MWNTNENVKKLDPDTIIYSGTVDITDIDLEEFWEKYYDNEDGIYYRLGDDFDTDFDNEEKAVKLQINILFNGHIEVVGVNGHPVDYTKFLKKV